MDRTSLLNWARRSWLPPSVRLSSFQAGRNWAGSKWASAWLVEVREISFLDFILAGISAVVVAWATALWWILRLSTFWMMTVGAATKVEPRICMPVGWGTETGLSPSPYVGKTTLRPRSRLHRWSTERWDLRKRSSYLSSPGWWYLAKPVCCRLRSKLRHGLWR